MQPNELSYIQTRIGHRESGTEKLYAVATKIIQTRVSYIYATDPERAAKKWSEGAEIKYEYLPDEVQKSEVVSVVDEWGTDTFIRVSRYPLEEKEHRRDTPELEL